MPQGPKELHQYARHLLTKREARRLPESTDAVVDISGALGKLSSKAEALGEVLITVERETRDTETSQVEKDRALEESTKAFSGYANLASLFLEMAGYEELASRLKPSHRRPGRTTEVAESEPNTETPAPTEQVG